MLVQTQLGCGLFARSEIITHAELGAELGEFGAELGELIEHTGNHHVEIDARSHRAGASDTRDRNPALDELGAAFFVVAHERRRIGKTRVCSRG